MTDKQNRADAFYSLATAWGDELAALRAILRASPLTEDFKWSSPVYTYDGANVAIVWGFKDRATLGFFKGVLMTDPQGILEAPGDNSRAARVVNFTDTAGIDRMAPTLRDYIDEAVRIEKSGLTVDLPKDDLDYPDELVDRLDTDAPLRTAFEALTPGRRRGWVLHFRQPKQSKTRIARIDRAAPRILAGMGMHDR